MENRLEAAKQVIDAIRAAGSDIYLTPDNKIYAATIPPELLQHVTVLLPEMLILLEREGRKSPPPVSEAMNRVFPDHLHGQRADLNRIGGFSQPSGQPGANLPPFVGQAVLGTPEVTDRPSGVSSAFLKLVALLGVGITCLSLFLALFPVAIIALAIGMGSCIMGRMKNGEHEKQG